MRSIRLAGINIINTKTVKIFAWYFDLWWWPYQCIKWNYFFCTTYESLGI